MPSKYSFHPVFFGKRIHINAIKDVSKEYARLFYKQEKERIIKDCLKNPGKYMSISLFDGG